MAEGAKKGDRVQVGNRQYDLHSFLGKGGFSEVFLGVDSTTRKRVALKIMTPRRKPDEAKQQLAQSTSEIKAMKQLNHPNVVRLLGYDLKCKVKGQTSIVMVQQLCPKGELFDYLMYTKKFKPQLAMAVFHQLCSGLNHMHEKNIAHRDLKPENLLFDNNYTLKIADFGFSHQYKKKNDSSSHKMRTELGTRGYMAPEILSSSSKYTQKADVFAAGVILFIMMAGFPPFQNAVKSDWWFDKLIKKKYSLFWKAHERTAKFETGAKDLLQKMMAPSEKDRLDIPGILSNNYVLAHANYQKNEVQKELAQRKAVVDVKKKDEKPDTHRALLMEVLEQLDLSQVKPVDDKSLSLHLFLKSEFHTNLLNTKSHQDFRAVLQQASEEVGDHSGKLIFEEEIAKVVDGMANQAATEVRDILLARNFSDKEGVPYKTLQKFFDEKSIGFFEAALKKTCVGSIDDWDTVMRLSQYEDDIESLPMYPTGYCNTWKTKIGFGVLVYCIQTFSDPLGHLTVDKTNHIIRLTLNITKKVKLPVEDWDGVGEEWQTGSIKLDVNLEFKLFKTDRDFNVLTIQNTTHFAMEEARWIIEELTTNKNYHLGLFLESLEDNEHISESHYHKDTEIDNLAESGISLESVPISWSLGL